MMQFPHSTALQAQMREAARLEALRKLDLLDSAPSESFDRITRMAAHIFDLPIAAISLTDSERQWFKSRVGVEHDSIPRLRAPCSHVADEVGLLVVPDLLKDVFFRDSHLARSGVRFYAGAPLMTDDGFCLGAMCVLGVQPRSISAAETVALLDLAAMVMSQIELEHAMGRVDAHSGLPNRSQFLHDVKDVGGAPAPEAARLAVLVNLASPEQLSNLLRVLGSACLDAMTLEAASLLGAALGPKRKLYHVGPAQFVFFAPADGARQACRQWLQQWQGRHGNATAGVVTTAGIGLAPFAATGGNAPDLLRNLHRAAEDALHAPDRVSLYSPAQDAAYRRRFTLFDEFGAALEMPAHASAQLRLVYQPRVALATGACTGVEALLRWEHPLLGAVPPAEFIPLMEQTALARALTGWVLEAAMRQLAAWRAAGVRRQLTVNVAAANLLEPGFAGRVLDGLARHDVPPACLALEMSERAVMDHPKTAPATLAALAAAGVPLLIDDVGAGCSSLSYLQGLPVTMVKIDHSLLHELGRDDERNARRRALVAAMIGLWQELGYRVVAEGVETAAVAAFLRDAGCDEAQGSLYAPPMPAVELGAWLEQR